MQDKGKETICETDRLCSTTGKHKKSTRMPKRCLWCMAVILILSWLSFQNDSSRAVAVPPAPVPKDFCKWMDDLWRDYCDDNFSGDPFIHQYCNNNRKRFNRDCKANLKQSLLMSLRIPWLSRMICKYLWHSYKSVINEHGALEWLICRRCGNRHNIIYGYYDE